MVTALRREENLLGLPALSLAASLEHYLVLGARVVDQALTHSSNGIFETVPTERRLLATRQHPATPIAESRTLFAN